MTPSSTVRTLPGLLADLSRRHGERPALLAHDQALTFAQLDQRSAALARGLAAAGVGKGTRIALLAPNEAFWLEALLAAARLGALLAPISTLSTAAELRHILRHCDAQVLLARSHYLKHDYRVRLEQALPGLEAIGSPRLRLKDAPFLRTVVWAGADKPAWATSYGDLIALGGGEAGVSVDLLTEIASEVAPSDSGVIIYTSGSTGTPKGVVHTQGVMVRQAFTSRAHLRLREDERVLTLLPLFWVGGLGAALATLTAGAALAFSPKLDPDSLLDTIQRHGVTRVNGWAQQLGALSEEAKVRGLNVSRVIGLGPTTGAAPPRRLGMTETFGPHSSEVDGSQLPPGAPGAFGRSIPGVERRVVDPETGAIVAPGEVGELWLRGATLADSLYKRDRSETFTPDGFYRTGDLVHVTPEGWLFLEGRLGDMLKCNGANVSRLEVEDALRDVPGVAEAVVVGLPHEKLGQEIVAAVVPAGEATLSMPELSAAVAERLSSYKRPRRILLIAPNELIWTASGKISAAGMQALIGSRLAAEAAPSCA